MLAYAALFAVSTTIETTIEEKFAPSIFVMVVGLYSNLVFQSFIKALNKFRARTKWIYDTSSPRKSRMACVS